MDSKKQSLGSAADSVNAAGQAWPRLEALVAALAAGARPAAAHVAAALAEDFSAAHVLVLAREQDREDLVALGSAGLEAADRRGDLLALARRLAGWVAASRLPLSLTDPAGDSRFAAETDYSRPIQVVPLVIGGSVEGALLVFDAAAYAFYLGRVFVRRERPVEFVAVHIELRGHVEPIVNAHLARHAHGVQEALGKCG